MDASRIIFKYLIKEKLLLEKKNLDLFLKRSLSFTQYLLNERKKKYSSTVLLPSTNFPRNPIKKERKINDVTIQKKSNIGSLYSFVASKNADALEFTLHDGPPYSNGKLHIGHAVNKILKDITIRYKLMRGFKINYRPGWDCHGLPIELKALEKERRRDKSINWKNMDPLEIREKACRLADEAIGIQKNTFESWGVLADWSNFYTTKNARYIAKELRLFGDLYEKGFIFQAFMPVIYSPSTGTTLAEAELEYKEDHESPSLFLAFNATHIPSSLLAELKLNEAKDLHLPIWTTTPWTLPGNTAICISPNETYSLIEIGPLKVLWISQNVSEIEKILNLPSKLITQIKGEFLSGIKYINPLNGLECPVLNSSHVTATKGTGLVHTAPCHGKEDFQVALKFGIEKNYQLVDSEGCYTEIAGETLRGKNILKEGNEEVLKLINALEDSSSIKLLHLGKILHKYPYDWRTKKPTLMRASEQWFFDIKKIEKKIKEIVNDVSFLPEHYGPIFLKTVSERSYWCISRQRSWGVPIPVFYDPNTRKPILSTCIINHIANLIEKEGSDIWWKWPEEDLLPSDFVADLKNQGKKMPIKGKDIFDIWFDAGSSWHCVLNGKKADIYLEGIDQLTGWFQSSLLISVAANGQSPFKKLFLHDFVIDEKKQKMSKSHGNVFDPIVITEGGENLSKHPVYGVNVLRWWVASESPFKQIPMGECKLQQVENEYISLRSVFWYVLATLKNFTPCKQIDYALLRFHDRYTLHRLKIVQEEVFNMYDNCNYKGAVEELHNFIVFEFGGKYVQVLKDILVCNAEDDIRRRAIQTTFYKCLPHFLFLVAPILPHLVEEVIMYYPYMTDNHPFYNGAKDPLKEWHQPILASEFEKCLHVKDSFLKEFQKQPSFRSFKVTITAGDSYFKALQLLQSSITDNYSDLCEFLQVSEVSLLNKTDTTDYSFTIEKATKSLCQRCFKFCVVDDAELCTRCKNVLHLQHSQ